MDGRVLRLALDAAEIRAIKFRIESEALLQDAFRDPDSPDVPSNGPRPFPPRRGPRNAELHRRRPFEPALFNFRRGIHQCGTRPKQVAQISGRNAKLICGFADIHAMASERSLRSVIRRVRVRLIRGCRCRSDQRAVRPLHNDPPPQWKVVVRSAAARFPGNSQALGMGVGRGRQGRQGRDPFWRRLARRARLDKGPHLVCVGSQTCIA
jgi:hypothetical protein